MQIVENLAQNLKEQLQLLIPDAKVSVECASEQPNGSWFIDIEVEARVLCVVEWVPGTGFGISLVHRDDGIGSGHQERVQDVDAAARRVVELCQKKPPKN